MMVRSSTRAGAIAGRARGAVRRHALRVETTLPGRLWSRLLEMEFLDRAVALAAKAFVALLPLLVIIAALSPDGFRHQLLDAVAYRFGIEGAAFDTVRHAFATPDQTRKASGILGVLLTLAFAVSFTTALQRVYLRAWRRPPGESFRSKGRGALWLAGVLIWLMIITMVRDVLGGFTGSLLTWTFGVTGSTLLWWWTARLMLRGEVRWRALLPTAVTMGAGTAVYTLAASVWMPDFVASHFAQFGAFGITQSLVAWFTGLALLAVTAAALGPVIAESDSGLARWMHAGHPPSWRTVRRRRYPRPPGPCGCPTPSPADLRPDHQPPFTKNQQPADLRPF